MSGTGEKIHAVHGQVHRRHPSHRLAVKNQTVRGTEETVGRGIGMRESGAWLQFFFCVCNLKRVTSQKKYTNDKNLGFYIIYATVPMFSFS